MPHTLPRKCKLTSYTVCNCKIHYEYAYTLCKYKLITRKCKVIRHCYPQVIHSPARPDPCIHRFYTKVSTGIPRLSTGYSQGIHRLYTRQAPYGDNSKARQGKTAHAYTYQIFDFWITRNLPLESMMKTLGKTFDNHSLILYIIPPSWVYTK